MTYTHEQIIDALKIIKTTCEDFKSCNGCPFNKDEICHLESDPVNWVLNDNENWKAFL